MRRFQFLASLFLLGIALACGGGSSSSPATPSGTLTLRLGADSFPGYAQVIVSLEKVEALSAGNVWIPLGDVHQTFDLLALQNGQSRVILPAKQMDLGTFSQFRLTWATINYNDGGSLPALVQITDITTRHPLVMPATTLVNGPITVANATDTVAQVMFSGQQAVQQRSGTLPFSFQATGQAYDLATSAHITGHLADGVTSLGGVEVYAETVDGSNVPAIQRRAFTDPSGNYTLEALPTGAIYFVVAQPTAVTAAYAAAASAPINAVGPTAYSADLSFNAPQTPGALALTITPVSAANQGVPQRFCHQPQIDQFSQD